MRGTRAALAAVVCGALAGIPALAAAQQQDPASGSVVAQDVQPSSGRWVINGDATATTVTIAAGGTVTFSYPSGTSHHDVSFTDAQPASCTGLPSGNPFLTGGPGWSGSCRFDHAGTYSFVCVVHPYAMTGTVVVKDQPAATPTPTPGATPTPTPTPIATPVATPPPATLRGAVALARRQTGTRVRGSVKVETARSRLEVVLRARLSGRRLVRVGRWRKTANAGRVAFSVPLTARARAALRRHHRLALTVTVALTPPGSPEVTRTLHTTVHRG